MSTKRQAYEDECDLLNLQRDSWLVTQLRTICHVYPPCWNFLGPLQHTCSKCERLVRCPQYSVQC